MEQKYEYTPLYYATPCQVRFFNYKRQSIEGGIALYNLIIGCHSGDIFITDKVVEEAAKYDIHWDDAVIELEWVDIERNIREG